MKLKTSEKVVRLIEAENTLVVEVEMRKRKKDIKKEFEEYFGGKIENMRTYIQGNKKLAYLRLAKSTPAIDIATKFGMI